MSTFFSDNNDIRAFFRFSALSVRQRFPIFYLQRDIRRKSEKDKSRSKNPLPENRRYGLAEEQEKSRYGLDPKNEPALRDVLWPKGLYTKRDWPLPKEAASLGDSQNGAYQHHSGCNGRKRGQNEKTPTGKRHERTTFWAVPHMKYE